MTAFSAVGVVIPARDEEEHVERCLHGVIAALLEVPVAAAVCLVLDRCTDRTADRAAAIAATAPVPVELLVNERPGTVGALRDLGVRHLLARLAHPPATTWLLSTDADTTVEPTWVAGHLRHARAGAHAVAGPADLDDAHPLGLPALDAYGALLDAGGHVYGANLGVRGDVYTAVGGFPSLPHGEDHALAAAVRAAGHSVVSAPDVRVVTSSRRCGRATGGLADLLSDLPGPVRA